MQEGKRLKGKELDQLKKFLEFMDLSYDEGIEHSVCLYNDDSEIIAAGSVDQNVLKCIAVHPDYQGQGLTGTLMSELIQYQYEHGRSHILLYTKPANEAMFSDLGFYTNENFQRTAYGEQKAGIFFMVKQPDKRNTDFCIEFRCKNRLHRGQLQSLYIGTPVSD